MLALFSGVQDRVLGTLAPLRAWLFPPRIYLQLDDRAVTAMALDGRRIVWLERVPLPQGLCENGEPVRVDSLSDLFGDLLVERGFVGARIDAVLPPAASQMRLVQWPGGRWPDDPERMLALNEKQLGFRTSLQYLDLHLIELDRHPPTSLVVSVQSVILNRWIEVFSNAGVSLDSVEAAKLCVCRGLRPILSSQRLAAVLQLENVRSSLLILEDGVPVFERRLPGAEQPDVLSAELERSLLFWRQSASGGVDEQPLLLVHGAALWPEAELEVLAAALGCPWRVIDPLLEGWLLDVSFEHDEHPDGPALAALWGLAAKEVLA
jgi:Tfp pilus assembly PilM family ATPase